METKENGDSQSVKRLGCIGTGGEAQVYLEVRSFFPGIGWDIYTTQRVACANREDFNQDGHRNFLRHVIVKKLDDYFISLGKYRDIHISRPLGSTDKGYLYEYVTGSGGFPWELFDGKERLIVTLEEWGAFVGTFSTAGVDLRSDISDADDGRISQNIIASFSGGALDYSNPAINSLWKRIDFGSGSIGMNYDKLGKFLSENREKLIIELSAQRYELMRLALEYLQPGKKMDRRDIGKLEVLTGEFRISTLSPFNKRGSSLGFSKKQGVYPAQQRIDKAG